MAELANALDVDGTIVGTVGQFGDAYQVDLKVISAVSGKLLGAYSAKAVGDRAMLDQLTLLAKTAAPEIAHRLNKPLANAAGRGSRSRATR